jgi:tryptophanyl-tRNA synthetase
VKDRVLSGMQASGKLHLGNLIGALSNWVRLQDQYDCYYFVADWHALTTILAAGIDPEKCTIFLQSKIPEHAELHLLLSMITPLGWLERVPTYKEKQQELKEKDLSTYGFLGYPLLQTADILIYRAKYVPVGIDQVPHLEISREIARRFNYLYRETFPEPEALLTEFAKVVGVDGRKMSKSYDNAIFLSDSPEAVRQKIMTMMTDPARVKRTDKGNPQLSPVYHLHKIFSSKQEQDEVVKGCITAGIGCIDCKKILLKNIFTVLDPIWKKRNELIANPDMLYDIVKKGTDKAKKSVEETMQLVRDAMGLY